MYRFNQVANDTSDPFGFKKEHIQSALKLKEAGIKWYPRIGCYIWDQYNEINFSSPFPENIYYILDIDFFIKRFGSIEKFAEKVVWIPTYLETLQFLKSEGIPIEQLKESGINLVNGNHGDELTKLYNIMLEEIESKRIKSYRKRDPGKELSGFHLTPYY